MLLGMQRTEGNGDFPQESAKGKEENAFPNEVLLVSADELEM